MRYVVQTQGGQRYTELFQLALEMGPFEEFSCAVAYVTLGGVHTLERMLEMRLGEMWTAMRKRWLVGIDWCRSDPPAIRRLAAMENSRVKIPNGRSLLLSKRCSPRNTFHPKLFVFSSSTAYAVICGSGNLSSNGFSRGCEVGSLLLVNRELPDDGLVAEEVANLLSWLTNAWRRADPCDSIIDAYESICRKHAKDGDTVPTDDDNPPQEGAEVRGSRGLTEEQIRELRTFSNLWIDAGPLGGNLGPGVPGNQLDMKRFTRAFFGAPIENVSPNTEIDHISLVWEGREYPDETLKFGNNEMDKLNVPPSGDRGRLFYQGKTLLFSRRDDGAFDFDAGDKSQRRVWKKRSRSRGVIHRLSADREWGLF